MDKTVKIIETNDGHGGVIRTPYTEASRKRAILRAIGLGFTMKEIADKWGLTVQQVREIKGQQ